ncbi:MAG: hypothetical protein QOJ03_1814, partial [Frankiaceae bacterium]|nr:hypothetical protein [Frankiaceae bacterium]
MMRRPSAMVTGAALSSVVALGLVLPTSALGDAPKKTFTVTLAVTDGGVAVTGPLAPAHTYGFAFTLTNGAKSPQAFGSAHIAVPTGYQADTPAVAAGPATFHLVVSGSTLALTNSGPTGSGVVPGSAITLTAHVTTPAADACQATPATWTTQVKQSNDFSG